MAKIPKDESTFNVATLINIGVDAEFINDLGQFFFERWSLQGLDEKGLALLSEAIETEHALEELLKDNKPAFALFLEYQNNRNDVIGRNSDKCYKQGFSDGVKFMTVALGEGVAREIEIEKLTADYDELNSRALRAERERDQLKADNIALFGLINKMAFTLQNKFNQELVRKYNDSAAAGKKD